jgi:hypothetical protein
MRVKEVAVVDTWDVRGAVVREGDIRGEIAFQNDINKLLASLSSLKDSELPLAALAHPVPAPERTDSIARLRRALSLRVS